MNVFPACNRLVCYKHKWKLTGIAFNCLSLSGIFNAEPCWQESGFATWHAIILFHSQNMAFLQCNSFRFSLRKFTTWGMMEQEEMQFHSTRVSSNCFQKKTSLLDSEEVLLTPAVWRSPVWFAFVWVRSRANLHSNFKAVQILRHHSILRGKTLHRVTTVRISSLSHHFTCVT